VKKVIVIGKNWPEPKTTAAGVHMMQLLAFFQEIAQEVVFASAASPTPFSEVFEQSSIRTKQVQLNEDSFNYWIKQEQPSLVVFDRFMVEEQFGWRVREAWPRALNLLNTEDLHSLREARGQLLSADGTIEQHWISSSITQRELASILRCDLSLLVSHFEWEWLNRHLPQAANNCLVLPFLFPELQPATIQALPRFDQRLGFVFIGNGKHQPNRDAVHWFAKKIWPLIRKELPKSDCTVVGGYWNSHQIEPYQKIPGLRFAGQTDQLDALMSQKRINLLPLRYGAGIKGKLAEGIRNGCVSISTSQGVEGLSTLQDFPGVIEDKAQSFAEKAVQIHENERLWADLQQANTAFFNANYSREKGHRHIKYTLEKRMKTLTESRATNLLQQLLSHQSLRSTEYLSRYIALKNQKE
jgi:hypothetical protein